MSTIEIGRPVCVAATGDRCGEGPVWHAGSQCVYWTDINRFLVHRYDPRHGTTKTWFFDEPVTALALTCREERLAVVLGSRLVVWNPERDERRDHGFRMPGWPAVRSNDARPDPRGSLWVGSMRNNVRPDGSAGECGGTDGVLYRIDPDGKVTEWAREIGISNTLAWSPDGTRFYFADTLTNVISVYRYDGATGAIADPQPFFAGFERGSPDGSAMDRAGYLWNCRYGGGCIVRLSPEGAIDRVIEIPAANVTSCTFGGEDYRTLYVTTAGVGGPAGDRLGGCLFAIRSEVAGMPENRFGVTA